MYDVREVDVHDDEAIAEWEAITTAVQKHDAPGVPPWRLEELKGYFRVAWTTQDMKLFAAYDDEMVGVARTSWSLVDTPEILSLEMYVHPNHRQRGTGRALMEQVNELAGELNRPVILVETQKPVDQESTDAGAAFATQHGFKAALVRAERMLTLPLDVNDIEVKEDIGYEVVRWRDALPEEWVADRARLAARMVTDSPMGDLEITEENWDETRLRETEEMIRALDRELWGVGAVKDGQLVAASELTVPHLVGWDVDQWDTIVDPDHRGHGLGLRIKMANLVDLMKERPDVKRVWTDNAVDNGPMIRINDAIGFTPFVTTTEWQRRGFPSS